MIKKYEVSNFKSVAHASLDLTKANVLLGLNSSGKSSLIQPLLLLRQSAVVGSLRDQRVSLNGPLVNLGTGQDVLSEFASDEVSTVSWDGTTVRMPYVPTASELTVEVSGGIRDDEPPLSNFIYISTARIPPQVLYGRHHQYESASPMVGAQGEDAPGYLAVHGNSNLGGDRTQRDKGATGTLLEQVTTWMGRISPEVSLSLNELDQLDGLELRFEFDGQAGVRTRPYRAGNVGFGLSHSLGVVLALVAAEAGSLVVLEGPEAHLHPRAQRFLGHLIGQAAGDGVQVIVETHSQEVVRGMSSAVSSGWLPRPDFTVHYCIRDLAETKVAQIQAGHDGRLKHVGGYDRIPEEYYAEFSP
ncbi:AAA family ATPase [Aeromicrobium sp. Root344]|uniref:AAA family ATPase n=1 Tax=Aeromicrobium sp. Root344 TaxID=1736521 RepID=UPI0009E7E9FB|nr:AAA family ATPase [Aeromicrobium sp. Root344]